MEYLGSTGSSNKNSSGLEEQNTGLAYNCSNFIVMCTHNETASNLSSCEVGCLYEYVYRMSLYVMRIIVKLTGLLR